MKLMNIVGWTRNKSQKKALKEKRTTRRLKREYAKYQFENSRNEARIQWRKNRRKRLSH